jgi:uncharacterized protein YycO
MVQTSVVFYHGIPIVRFWLKSHYGHVAFRYNDTLVEAVSVGVSARQFGLLDIDRYARQIQVDLTDPERAAEFAAGQIGKSYDWGAIRQDFLARFVPYLRYEDVQEDSWDCSRLVQAVLQQGGHDIQIAHWPVTPQDLYLDLTKVHPFGFPQKRLPDFTPKSGV